MEEREGKERKKSDVRDGKNTPEINFWLQPWEIVARPSACSD